MSLLAIIGIAFGLAMDAFAVSISVGVILCQLHPRQIFRLSFHFGLFQFFMPVIGWYIGSTMVDMLAFWDHWIAFVLLLLIGGKMIYDSLSGGPDHDEAHKDPTKGMTMVMLSIATSIDALAIGLTLAMLKVNILLPCIIIGIVAGGMTWIGMVFGCRLGMSFGKRMESVGGVVLVGIGSHILYSHLSV